MTIVVLIASIVIAVRDFKHINKKEFLKITFFMVLGLPIGMWIFTFLKERPLKILLGIFMIIVSIKGIYDGIKSRNINIVDAKDATGNFINEVSYDKDKKYKDNKKDNYIKIMHNITLFLGGIIHGAFTCGGPFVVMYATKNIKDKSSFRATLCALWATLNAIMLAINIFRGEINFEIVSISLITMLFVVVAIILSNIVHKKIKGESFTKFVYIALFISGILMMI